MLVWKARTDRPVVDQLVSVAVRPSMRRHLGARTRKASRRNPSGGSCLAYMRRQIPKLDVAGSTPVARSREVEKFAEAAEGTRLPRARLSVQVHSREVLKMRVEPIPPISAAAASARVTRTAVCPWPTGLLRRSRTPCRRSDGRALGVRALRGGSVPHPRGRR